MKEKNIKKIINEEILKVEGVGDDYLANKYNMPGEFDDFEKQYKASKSEDEVIHRDGDWILYKNPKTLDNIGESARGVIDSEGNLYIENYSLKIHHDIIKILISKGLLKGYEFKKNWNKFLPQDVGFLTIQRYNNGPIAIGHSNKLIYDQEGFKKYYDDYNAFMVKARAKNPGIKFETKLVSSKFRILKQQSALSESNKLSQYENKYNHYMGN